MAGLNTRKRNHKDIHSKLQRPGKKQKKSQEYRSDSSEPEPEPESSNPNDFKPVNLLDSDNEDLDNIAVDDLSFFSGAGSDSDSGSDSDAARSRSKPVARRKDIRESSQAAKKHDDSSHDEDDDDYDDDEDEDEDEDENEDGEGAEADAATSRSKKSSKSKRNDPSAFSTSMSKILSSKLSTSRRADPVLSRSAEAHKAAQEAVDNALESKARRYLREQKRLALEKGRVKDVLTGATDDGVSTADVVQAEKRLRKVAHRGVVVLFRAVREAQERAAEAERDARKDGVFGVARREEKVHEMSRQGFLDLIAGGGGKLKKGPLEEA
ncbi:Rrp15p-domain-containing protein [Biscogniauxia mediterranea]|nr:Rrp15p-domain-containing protein [Biscogniauxia mediterranea]